MAKIAIQKGTNAYVLFQDFWTLTQELWGVEQSDDYWEEVRKKTGLFVKKHNHSPYATDLALSLMKELERRSKEEM